MIPITRLALGDAEAEVVARYASAAIGDASMSSIPS